jgi:hypothetical protein
MLKQIVESSDQNGAIKREGNKVFMKAYVAASTMTAGQPYVLQNYDHGVQAIAVATLGVAHTVGIALETNTTAGDYWFQIQGPCEALVDGTTDVAVNAFLEVVNAGTALISDHGSVRSTNSVAVAVDARTTDSAALASVWLIGDPVIIAAS